MSDMEGKNTEITIMTKEMYAAIAEADDASFNRGGNLRSERNMDLLRESFPSGCLVMKKDNHVIGYAFSKVLGTVGYIGPIGIRPEQQAKGYAKELLEECIRLLKQAGCSTIGLETMPESGKHIGLYQGAGFELTFPSVTYQCPEQPITEELKQVIRGSEADPKKVEDFDQRLSEEYAGLRILSDIQAAIKESPERVVFYNEQDRITGVLLHCKELYRYVYGAFLKSEANMEQFITLYSALRQAVPGNMQLRISSRYRKATALQDYGFRVLGSHARLTYRGHHGIYDVTDPEGFIIKGWVG